MSGTMLCAHKAGIPLFVTGGIGGVHREGESCECTGVSQCVHQHAYRYKHLLKFNLCAKLVSYL